jgi:hypothetical protein
MGYHTRAPTGMFWTGVSCRRMRNCELCGRTIEKGNKYFKYRLRETGRPTHVCAKCAEANGIEKNVEYRFLPISENPIVPLMYNCPKCKEIKPLSSNFVTLECEECSNK